MLFLLLSSLSTRERTNKGGKKRKRLRVVQKANNIQKENPCKNCDMDGRDGERDCPIET